MLEALDDIEAAYEERDIPSTVETTACELPDNLREGHFAAMVARGYRPHQIEGLYYAEADKVFAPASNDVEIARVSGEAAAAEFLELYLTGWEYPEDIAQIWRGIGSKMQADPNYTAFMARVGGEPAGCAQLYCHDGIGYLADAVVLPKFRRRGCQRALFAARRDVAIERSADLIFSIAEIAGQSARNMEAFGMRLAAELWHWRKDVS